MAERELQLQVRAFDPPTLELRRHRCYLLTVATMQLGDRLLAEDVVHETLLVAIEGWASFRRRSSIRSWLTGILKHKVIDALRRRTRVPAPIATLRIPEARRGVMRLFDERGTWWVAPTPWEHTGRAMMQPDFLRVLEVCLAKLPPATARAFLLREVMEMEASEIAASTTVSASQLGMVLYRARMAMRECLTENWFSRSEFGS